MSKKSEHKHTIFSVGVEGGHLWFAFLDALLPVHALLQPLEHALLTNPLDVPPECGRETGKGIVSNKGRGLGEMVHLGPIPVPPLSPTPLCFAHIRVGYCRSISF